MMYKYRCPHDEFVWWNGTQILLDIIWKEFIGGCDVCISKQKAKQK